MVIFTREHRIILGVSLISVLVLILVIICFPYLRSVSREASLVIAFENDGQGRMFMGEVIDGMTVLDALITSSNAGQIKLKYRIDADGQVRILEFDGHNEDTVDKLLFYLNDQKIDGLSISRIEIKPGDIILIDDK